MAQATVGLACGEPTPAVRPEPLVRLLPIGLVAALGPALALATIWSIANTVTHPDPSTDRCFDYVLYAGLVSFRDLDSADSAALAEIRQVVEEAVRQGHVPPGADYRDRGTVIRAYAGVRQASFAEATAVMGRAGRDVLLEHPWPAARGALKHAAWLLMLPDPVYRFQPGGAAGVDGKRRADAALFDIGTYSFGPGSWEPTLAAYRHYLPLTTEPRPLTGAWSAFARWFYSHVDCGDALLGLRDSIYEELMAVCLMAGLATLVTRDRQAWLLIAVTIGLHIGVSAFFGGPQARYTAPIKPLLLLYPAFVLGQVGGVAMWVVDRLRRPKSAFPALCESEGLERAVDPAESPVPEADESSLVGAALIDAPPAGQ
jgi:hypothetical protein